MGRGAINPTQTGTFPFCLDFLLSWEINSSRIASEMDVEKGVINLIGGGCLFVVVCRKIIKYYLGFIPLLNWI